MTIEEWDSKEVEAQQQEIKIRNNEDKQQVIMQNAIMISDPLFVVGKDVLAALCTKNKSPTNSEQIVQYALSIAELFISEAKKRTP